VDLIYANEKKEDVGVLQDYHFDLAFGKDENNFQLTINRKKHCCKAGFFVYIEGTEYGGVVDSIHPITKNEEVIYEGRTWHGMLENKVIEPDAGEDYLIVSGDANEVVSNVVGRLGLSDFFEVSTIDSGIDISNYQFPRYIYAYSGIRKMLVAHGGKLMFEFKDGKVHLSVVPLIDYSQDEQFDSDQVELDIKKEYTHINHVICLGKGELKDRQVIHLYADEDGNISKTQSIFGENEMVYIYEYTSAESLSDLEEGGIEKLKEFITGGSVNMDFETESIIYDIDDVVGSKDIITGIEVTASITKKIVTINKGQTMIEYEVGE